MLSYHLTSSKWWSLNFLIFFSRSGSIWSIFGAILKPKTNQNSEKNQFQNKDTFWNDYLSMFNRFSVIFLTFLKFKNKHLVNPFSHHFFFVWCRLFVRNLKQIPGPLEVSFIEPLEHQKTKNIKKQLFLQCFRDLGHIAFHHLFIVLGERCVTLLCFKTK